MKLSENTLDVIRSFSDINPSIFIKGGSVIKTHPSTGGSPLAKATVTEEFPVDVCIRDIRQFLKITKLFNDPDFEFKEDKVVISDKTREATYRYSDPATIEYPDYEKNIKLPSVDVQFNLSSEDIKSAIISANAFNMRHIMISGDGSNIYISCTDTDLPKNQRNKSDTFKVKVGETDKEFNMTFDIPSLSLIKEDCSIDICLMGIAYIKMKDSELWIMPIAK